MYVKTAENVAEAVPDAEAVEDVEGVDVAVAVPDAVAVFVPVPARLAVEVDEGPGGKV